MGLDETGMPRLGNLFHFHFYRVRSCGVCVCVCACVRACVCVCGRQTTACRCIVGVSPASFENRFVSPYNKRPSVVDYYSVASLFWCWVLAVDARLYPAPLPNLFLIVSFRFRGGRGEGARFLAWDWPRGCYFCDFFLFTKITVTRRRIPPQQGDVVDSLLYMYHRQRWIKTN